MPVDLVGDIIADDQQDATNQKQMVVTSTPSATTFRASPVKNRPEQADVYSRYGNVYDKARQSSVVLLENSDTPKLLAQDEIADIADFDGGSNDVISIDRTGIAGAMPRGFVYDCRLTYASASTVYVGQDGVTSLCRDVNDTFNISLSGKVTVDITSSGVNGLDTGAEAGNSWYYVYIIADSSKENATAGILAKFPTGPTMPSGYDKYRLIGQVFNDGSSNFLAFEQVMHHLNQNERIYYYDSARANLRILNAGAATSFTSVLTSRHVPVFKDRWAIFVVEMDNSHASSAAADRVHLRTTNSTNATPVDAYGPGVKAANYVCEVHMKCVSGQIKYKVDNSNDDAYIFVKGYFDTI